MTGIADGWDDRDAPAVLAMDLLCVDPEEGSAWRASGLGPDLALRARRAGLHPHEDGIERVTSEQVDLLLGLRGPVPPGVLNLLANVRGFLATGDNLDARNNAILLAQFLKRHPARPLANALNDAARIWTWAEDDRAVWPHRERAALLADALAAALGAPTVLA